MAEIHGPIGPRFEPVPSEPPLEPVSTPSSQAKILSEKQLWIILKNFLGMPTKNVDLHQIMEQSFPMLPQEQKENLIALVPPEQDYSDQTPNVNIVIEEKQRRDLTKICKNPIYHNPSLILSLPDPSTIQYMSAKEVSQKLNELTAAVSTMMTVVHFHPQEESPQALLRNPSEISELRLRYFFCPVLEDDASTLFRKREQVQELMRAKIHEMRPGIEALELASLERKITVSEACTDRGGLLYAIPKALLFAKTPEAFYKAFFDALNTLTQHLSDRQTLVKNLCQYIQSKIDSFLPLIDLEDIKTYVDQILEGPALGRENEWISQIQKLDDLLGPQTFLLEMTKSFLAPYLEGKITKENENVDRKELKDELIPEFRSYFPRSKVTDTEIQHFLLSAYLKIATKGVDVTNLEKARDFYKEQEGQAKLNRDEKAARLHIEKAEEIQEAIDSVFINFTLALEHSLPIDFKSMQLTEKEIDWVAIETMMYPNLPLPLDWRDQAKKT